MVTIKNLKDLNNIPKLYVNDVPLFVEAISKGLYKEDKDIKKVIDHVINEINIYQNINKETTTTTNTKIKTDGLVKKISISSINIDKKRFQNRSKLNQTVLNNIVENYNPTILDPLIVWQEKNKTFLLAGHHRLEATKIKGIKTISVKFFKGTEKEAIHFAKVESNSNRSLETPIERAKIYRELRNDGLTKKEVLEKAKKIEGKNANYIINLSYLKTNGAVLVDLSSFEDADKQNIAIIEKVADWIGQAFRNYHTLLTGAQEKEMYDFLISKDSLRIKTKVEFLQKINSIVTAIDYEKEEPLNLKRFKYISTGEELYNKEYSLIKDKIDFLIDKKTEFKNRFNNPKSKDFVNPKAKYYSTAIKELDKQMVKIDNELKHHQNELIQLQTNKKGYINTGTTQGALFGVKKGLGFVKEVIDISGCLNNSIVPSNENNQLQPKTNQYQPNINQPVATENNQVATENNQVATENNQFATENNQFATENNQVATENNQLQPTVKTDNSLIDRIKSKVSQVKASSSNNRQTLNTKLNTNKVRKFFTLDSKFAALQSFLGNVEMLENESAVMTLSSPQGGGKTTAFFQMMNAFAESGYKVNFASLEEHPESYLFEKKANQYLSESAKHNITAPNYNQSNIQSFWQDVEDSDVIFIDSMKKLWQYIKGVDLDNDMRKKFKGKFFIIIFQLTSSGAMRGGTDAQFDGDIISFIEKGERFEDNYIYHDKNRYATQPIHETKYNISTQSLLDLEDFKPLPNEMVIQL